MNEGIALFDRDMHLMGHICKSMKLVKNLGKPSYVVVKDNL